MAKPKVKLNGRGVRRVLISDDMYDALEPIAQRMAATARSVAPVDSGTYQDSITVERDLTDRAVYRVVAQTNYALKVEAKHGTLGSALGAG